MSEDREEAAVRQRHSTPWRVCEMNERANGPPHFELVDGESSGGFASLYECEKRCCAEAELHIGVTFVPVKVGRAFRASEQVKVVVEKK